MAFGVGFGWATSRAFLRSDSVPVSYPILQITGYIALAGVAALLASVIPARRADRLTVIDGLAADLSPAWHATETAAEDGRRDVDGPLPVPVLSMWLSD